ncbi:hypothetical protein AAF712_016785, partial [Marasmius tenuissimus]
ADLFFVTGSLTDPSDRPRPRVRDLELLVPASLDTAPDLQLLAVRRVAVGEVETFRAVKGLDGAAERVFGISEPLSSIGEYLSTTASVALGKGDVSTVSVGGGGQADGDVG